MKTYEIGANYLALVNIIHDVFTDPETGEPKEPTQEDKDYLASCFKEIQDNAENKIDNIGKIIRNIEFEADLIEAEKNILYAEVERLRKRIAAHENKVKGLKGLAAYLMEKMNIRKIKTPLFSFGWQATKKCAKPIEGFFDPDKIPVEFLKRELYQTVVNKAIHDGILYEKEGGQNRSKLFYKDANNQETYLEGVSYTGGETLVMR